MDLRKTIGFVLSVISVAGINLTLIEMWIGDDFSGGQTMILYWLENSAAIFLAVIFVFLFAPKADRIEKPRTRGGTIGFYLLLAIPVSVGSAIFFSFYAIHEMANEIHFPEIVDAMA